MVEADDIVEVAVEAGRKVLVHARGSPARIVAVGIAVAVTVVAVGVGWVCPGRSRPKLGRPG